MLNLANRLKKKRDFDLILKHGTWVNGRFLSVKALELDKIKDFYPKREDPKKFEKQLKIAIVVGLKVSKSAVKRNALKRKISEAVRLIMKDLGLKTGYYFMINAKPEALDKDYSEISQEINFLFKKFIILL